MKVLNKTISAGLAVMMLMPSVIPLAASASASKEEVIYIMSDAGGSVNGVYAVNIFGKGDVTDYGDYTDVKLLNTNDAVEIDGDKITFSTDSEKAYCQGTLADAEIPWNISIRYFLDGKELPADEIAGKSGSLEIKFKVEKNDSCKTDFYDSFALQAAFTLDTEICTDIKADGATSANVGSCKQLSYTILPGKGIDTSITADVKDFEMSAVSINGVKMNLDIEVDDSEITDKVTELNDGIDKIDDGANELSDGSGELKDGCSSLKDGSSQLSDGAESLDSGIIKLSNGITNLQNGLNQLNSQSGNLLSGSSQVKSALLSIQSSLNAVSSDTENLKKLTAASGEIHTAITNLKKGADSVKENLSYEQYKAAMSANGLDIDALSAGNSQAIENLNSQISELNTSLSKIQNVPGYEEQAAQLNAQIYQLSQTVKLLEGNNGAIYGTEQYLNSLYDGVSQLYSGLSELEKSYSEFDSSISNLAAALSAMLVNVSKLSDGIDTLTAQYSEFDDGINAYTAGVNKIAEGYSQLTEGVSEIAAGSKTLAEGSKSLDSGVSDLYDGITALCDGAGELSDGVGELKGRTSGMNEEIETKIDDMISSVKGSDDETVSFVSDKNTSVKSVQFVIKTEPVEIPEEEYAEEQETQQISFWQKMLNLF
ncbi:MAG: hypothetical protein ACI4JM_13300 [Oscillospiraceae bacterium]